MSYYNCSVTLLILYIVTNLNGLVDCNVKSLLATGKPVLVDEEVLTEKYQKFKVVNTIKPDIVIKSQTITVRNDSIHKPTSVNQVSIIKPHTNLLRKQTVYRPSLRPIVLDPVRPHYVITQKNNPSRDSQSHANSDKSNDKEVVLASYRVVIPVFIPKVLVPVHEKAPQKEERIKFVETKSTKMVPVERNVTYIEEIYKPEIVPQKIITDYVVKDPNNKTRIVKTVVKDVTGSPIKLH